MRYEPPSDFLRVPSEKRDDPFGQKFQAMTAPPDVIRRHGHPKLLNHAFPCRDGFVLIGFQNDPHRAIYPLGVQSKAGFTRIEDMCGLEATGDPSRPYKLSVLRRLGAFNDWVAFAQEWVRIFVDGQPMRLA